MISRTKLIGGSYMAVQMLNSLDLGLHDSMTRAQYAHLAIQVSIAGAVALHCYLADPKKAEQPNAIQQNIVKTLAILVIIALLPGCANQPISDQKAAVVNWWRKPQTQQAVKIGERALASAIVSGGLNLLGQEINGGQIDYSQAAFSAGSAVVRTFELSPDANNASKLVGAVEQNVIAVTQDPAQAKAVASTVLKAVNAATNQGAEPSGALEGIAQGLDATASNLGMP